MIMSKTITKYQSVCYPLISLNSGSLDRSLEVVATEQIHPVSACMYTSPICTEEFFIHTYTPYL